MPSICQKCGNGKREGTEECDDQNKDDLDGCSSECKVEEGFECSEKDQQSASICGPNEQAQEARLYSETAMATATAISSISVGIGLLTTLP